MYGTCYVKEQKFKNLDNLEGSLLQGTVFNDLNIPYKNYTPKDFKIEDKLKSTLLILQELDFYCLDISLFLMTHEDNKEAIELYKKYNQEYNKMKMYFEKNFYPIEKGSNFISINEWNYNFEPWPWEG